MTEAYGSIAWWGFTPQIDFIETLKDDTKFPDEINILLVGQLDARHMLKTLSHNHNKQIHFYLVENSLELYARQMLFLEIAVDSDLNVDAKSDLCLDLHGNSFVKKNSFEYVKNIANDLIKNVTGDSQQFDLSRLKYKEKDALEEIFKYWRLAENLFDISHSWETRQRKQFGVRYDSRENAYDWEYSMRLKEIAPIVGWLEYKSWRETGVAFNNDTDVSCLVPNKTLASTIAVRQNGERIAKRGYWGDMMVGPFVSLGVESENKKLFEKNNNIQCHTSTQVAKYNLTAMFHEITHATKYTTSLEEEKVSEIEDEEELSVQKNTDEMRELIKRNINFLPIGSVLGMHKSSRFQNKFDIVYFANSMVHQLDSSIASLFASNESVLVVESTKFMLDLKKETHDEYTKKINALACNAKCKPLHTFDAYENNYAYFKFDGS